MSSDPNGKSKVQFLARFAMLLAIEAIVCFTPLGSLPAIGPIVATLGMVPVVITAILLGVGAGTLMGFFAGLFSFIVWTFMPPSPLVAFVFTPFYTLGELGGNAWSLVICFLPRILVGTVAGLVFRAIHAKDSSRKRDVAAFGLSGALGSLVNTFLVLFGIYLFFGEQYAAALGIGYQAVLAIIGTTILTSGIPEAVIAAVAAFFVCRPLLKRMKK